MNLLYTLSTDDDLEIAFNKFHALLLSLPKDTRFVLLRRVNVLYLGERRRLKPQKPSLRGQFWKDPEKREATITSMRGAKGRREEAKAATAVATAEPPVTAKT